ncbi:hypothetical protein BDF20DRAFT_909896 [Mycotypha africana]|uniref:uncharacterized protein n=1 Tax=Mycotypha africana TaxID=64632 RepID=UPI0023006B2E|nr:uncharacterized protein BDF20DRAFT_909896 [Mycotypha africana]KAI8987256.1 hypothetical protein BDF20DRAFT_909896 [Mycotypha africana]
MVTNTNIPNRTSCLVQSLSSKKRRSPDFRRVHFCTQPQRIIYTYSHSDYDRSGPFYDIFEHYAKEKFIVALSISFVQLQKESKQKQEQQRPKPFTSTTSITTISQKTELPADNTRPKQRTVEEQKLGKRKRPNLSVDTTNMSPLYLTNLTTNYQSKRLRLQSFKREDISLPSPSPFTAVDTITTSSFDSYNNDLERDDSCTDDITKKNARRNSLPFYP